MNRQKRNETAHLCTYDDAPLQYRACFVQLVILKPAHITTSYCILQMSQKNSPLKYGVVLFPGFQALDVFLPLDVLNLLSQTQPLQLSMLAATLEPVSTALLAGGFGQTILPTHTFTDAPTDLEVLIIPGGRGTRDSQSIAPVLDFVKRTFPELKYLLATCTGSVIAAMAGVLDGRRATSNKMALKWVRVLI